MALRDTRRLGRAVLQPDFSHIGPDAADVGREPFRRRFARGSSAGEGPAAGPERDLRRRQPAGRRDPLARAQLNPRQPAGELTVEETDHLRRAIRAALRDAIRDGGAHTGRLNPHRPPGGACPRCGTPLERATVGGRTTFWCPVCQPD